MPGGGTDAAACFIKWRDGNKSAFNAIVNDIKLHTTKLNIADAKFSATNGDELKFIVDNGKITGIKIGETDYKDFYKTNVQSPGNVSLDTVIFSADGKEVGLTYSDFGTYTISRWNYGENGDPTIQEKLVAHHVPFAGGYASQQIEADKITKDLHFYGRAVGNASDDNYKISLNGNAWLNFDAKTAQSTLSAMFLGWYDIEVKDDGTITFDSYLGDGNVRFGNDREYTKSGAIMNVGFYGENPASNIPTEATGTVQFHDTDTNIKMDIAFGVK